MDYGLEEWNRLHSPIWFYNSMGSVCWMGCVHGRCPHFDGGFVSVSARSQIALGGVSEQVLQRRRL